MGFVPEPTLYRLRFKPGDPLAGLEVDCLGLTMAEFLVVTNMDRDITPVLRMLAGKIVQWNVERKDGTPVPVSYDELLALPDDTVFAIQRAWMNVTTGVSDPLEQGSTNGDRSVEASLPMAPLSASLVS